MSDVVLKGAFKLIEEMGEVQQILGKFGPFPDGNHPDGKGDLTLRLQEELGDLTAAIAYIVEANGLDGLAIIRRSEEKLTKFTHWGLHGISTEAQDSVPKGGENVAISEKA